MVNSKILRRLRSSAPVLIFLLLLIGTEMVSAVILNHVHVAGAEQDIFEHDKAVSRGRESYDVLFLGDSTAAHGAIPRLFTQATGASAYNLATYAGVAAFADLSLLESYLQKHAAPQAIFVTRSAEMWSTKQAYDVYREDFSRSDITSLLWRNGLFSDSQISQQVLADLLPSIHLRYQWLHAQAERPTTSPQQVIDMRRERGYIRLDTVYDPASSNADAGSRILMDGADHYGVLPENLLLLSRLCDVAAEHHIQVYILTAPFASAPREQALTYNIRKLQRTLRVQLENQKTCHVIGGATVSPDSLMADLTHLNNTGAVLFTRKLADLYKHDRLAKMRISAE